MARLRFPAWMSFWVSRAKVENVVNPPKNPVTARGEIQVGWWDFRNPKMMPMSRQPRRFAVRMP